MNWDAIGAIGELVGAAAVFATLLFLAIQVRQSNRANEENTRIAIAEMKHRSNDAIARWTEFLITNRELDEIWTQGLAAQPLSLQDQSRFNRLARNYLGLHASSYHDFDAIRDQQSKDKMIDYVVRQIAANQGLQAVWVFLKDTPFSNYTEFCQEVDAGLLLAGVKDGPI